MENKELQLTRQTRSYEKFSAVLLLIAGFFYLALWIVSVFSETSAFVKLENDKISMKTSELLSHIRTVITILFSVAGGWLLFKKNKWGWILGLTVLLLLLIICSGAVYQAINLDEPFLMAIAGTCWLILFVALLFLLLPPARRKLGINKPAIVTAGLFSVFLIMFYFFFQ